MEAIIESADVVLVARGDLGVEMDLEKVPLLQNRIVRGCQGAGKPVIIATQMLQSMVTQPTATRAEVSDVANAILDAADGVMLSAETSVGAYPVESVEMLGRIAKHTENYLRTRGEVARVDPGRTLRRLTTAVAHGASLLAHELEAKLVAVWTETGNTARLLSKTRLGAAVVGLSPSDHVCRRMSMYYGVVPVRLTRDEESSRMFRLLDAPLLERRLADPGNLIVVIAGTRLERHGETNALLVHLVGGDDDEQPPQSAG